MAERDRDPQARFCRKETWREREAMADLEALLRSAQAALTTASETVPPRRRASRRSCGGRGVGKALAASGAGDVAKTNGPGVSIAFASRSLGQDFTCY